MLHLKHQDNSKEVFVYKSPLGDKIGEIDEGMFMFYSPLFGSAITRRFELTEIMRQFDKDFLSALQDDRVGKYSNDAEFSQHAYEESRRFVKGSTTHLLQKATGSFSR